MKKYIQKNTTSSTSIPKLSPLLILTMCHAYAEIPSAGRNLKSSLFRPLQFLRLLPLYPVQSTIHHRLMVRGLQFYCTRWLKSPSQTGVHIPVLPTPSPELGHPSAHVHPHQSHSSHDVFLPNHPMPSWDTLRNGPGSVPTGSKRAHDGYNVDDFFTDMKKRRVAPSYDPR